MVNCYSIGKPMRMKEPKTYPLRTPPRCGSMPCECWRGRAHSTGELREKLRGKAESAADVDPTIARLKEYGYLNDRKFAENFAAARLENEGLGKTRVLADLSRRRVAPAVAQQTVGKVYEDIDEQALAEDFVRRKFRMASKENLFQDEKQMASAYRRLCGRGFDRPRSCGAEEVRAQSGSAGWVRAAGRNRGISSLIADFARNVSATGVRRSGVPG